MEFLRKKQTDQGEAGVATCRKMFQTVFSSKYARDLRCAHSHPSSGGEAGQWPCKQGWVGAWRVRVRVTDPCTRDDRVPTDPLARVQ